MYKSGRGAFSTKSNKPPSSLLYQCNSFLRNLFAKKAANPLNVLVLAFLSAFAK